MKSAIEDEPHSAPAVAGDFHPIISYLFTEWKCNLDCHNCRAYHNSGKGMTEEVARRSIDWLYDTRSRVLALMGGEVLLRPEFAHKVVDYAVRKGFWVYVPASGRLIGPEAIDRLGDAGVAAINLAVDCVDEHRFHYLIRKQRAYGFSVLLTIDITRMNLGEVIGLTEIAHDAGIAAGYHLNSTGITPEDWPKVDAAIDWLIEKNRSGYKLFDSVRRLEEMKAFVRGTLAQWDWRAGQNSLIIRTDGTLAPCYPTYRSAQDWGTERDPCSSALNHNLAYCYDASRAIRWVLKQAANGCRRAAGSFED